MSHFVLTCGPTGVGKTHQMQRLLQAQPQRFSAFRSVTTRQRRPSEDDTWYRFISEDEFDHLDPSDIISSMSFRDKRYATLRSEIDQAFRRAPIVFAAIVPWVVDVMREKKIPHILLNCRVGDIEMYRKRLRERGYEGQALEDEIIKGCSFLYPEDHPAWPSVDVFLGYEDDAQRFDQALHHLLPELLPLTPV